MSKRTADLAAITLFLVASVFFFVSVGFMIEQPDNSLTAVSFMVLGFLASVVAKLFERRADAPTIGRRNLD